MHASSSRPTAPTVLQSLALCSDALAFATADLERSNATLATAVADGPRLRRVLSSRQAYQLVTEAEVRTAQYALAGAVEAPLRELFERAEASLDRLQQRTDRTNAARAAAAEAEAAARPRPQPNLSALKSRLALLQAEREELARTVQSLETDVERKQAQLEAANV